MTKKQKKIKQQDVENQFDYYCKKIITGEVKNYYKKQMMETTKYFLAEDNVFENLSEKHINDNNDFIDIDDFKIMIENDMLFDALNSLNNDELKLIILAYFLELNDAKISEIYNIPRRTINYRRNHIIKKLKYFIESENL